MPENRHAWLLRLFDSGEHITQADAIFQGRQTWFDALVKENALVHSGNVTRRIANLFNGHPTWKSLIEYGKPRGTCRLLVN